MMQEEEQGWGLSDNSERVTRGDRMSEGQRSPRYRVWIEGQAPSRQSTISAILIRQVRTSCPQERIGQDVTVIHERLSLATCKPIEVGAHPLNALNDAGRRATGRITSSR
jgi:hypothetical protein